MFGSSQKCLFKNKVFLETIKHNLNLIELPNKTINLLKYSLENYEIVPASLKNFKNLKLVTEITNEICN